MAAGGRAAEPRGDRPILVVLELSGGNDGLNTVVPHADDVYHKSRPTLRIEPGKVLKLDHASACIRHSGNCTPLWDAGDLAVVQGVGYPEPESLPFPVDGDLADRLASSCAAGWLAGAAGR